jgi:hypothetical protein
LEQLLADVCLKSLSVDHKVRKEVIPPLVLPTIGVGGKLLA